MQDRHHSEHHHDQGDHPDRERPEREHGPRRFREHGPEDAREHLREHAREHGWEDAREERHPHHGHWRGERNFWSEWRDERHHHRGEEIPMGQALSPKEMEAWREFFHQTFGNWPEDHWIFGGRRFSPWHQGMDTFNPFVATLLSKGGGLLPLYVLHLIAQQPRYGNEIMELLADRTNGQWVSNPGAIYPLLTLLEKEGFIEGKWEDPDKRTVRIYTITPSGQSEVSRIEMIVMPKLTETMQVLQELINDLQSAKNEAEATEEQSAPEEQSTTEEHAPEQPADDTTAQTGTEPL